MNCAWTALTVALIVAAHVGFGEAMNDGGIAAPVDLEAAVAPPTQFRGSASPDFAAPSDIKSCGCGRPGANVDSTFESLSFLQVSCEGINCACEKELQKFEAYCRSKSAANRPDGRCYFSCRQLYRRNGVWWYKENGI